MGVEFTDLREFLDVLSERGKLYRWRRPINKETELLPLMRLQYRGIPDDDRKAFLYDNVTDVHGRKYEMRVLTGVYGGSRSILALGVGCEDPQEIYEKWRSAIAHPVEPVLVDRGPVQEEVHVGEELKELGLDELPVPVEEPGFSGDIRTTTPFITRDPKTGVRNVGTYSGHFKARDRMTCGIAVTHHLMLYHWRTARGGRKALPAAITIGPTPEIVLVGAANIPYGIDELAVAGALRGRPVELVPCKTVPLEVPAHAEIVIEGEISTEVMEPAPAFSDYPGYLMAEHGYGPVMKVTAITHRKNAIFTPILVGLPPSESNAISRTCREMTLYNFLKYHCNLPTVLEVSCPEMGGGWNWWVIRMQKTHPSQPRQALQAASGLDPCNKVIKGSSLLLAQPSK